MSSHSLKAKRRHPDADREHFEVAHVTFEIRDQTGTNDPSTFALVAGEAVFAKDRRPMFSGFLTPDMPDQLRALAARLDPICFDLRKRDLAQEEGGK